MDRRVRVFLAFAGLVAIVTVCGSFPVVTAAPSTGSGPVYLSPIAMVADKTGKTLYIAQATANRVDIFDVASGKVTKSVAIGAPVSGLALSADSSKLYVTAEVPDGQLCVVDVKGGKVAAKIPVGNTPTSPVVSPDGKHVYVCNRFSPHSDAKSVGTIGVIDLAAGKQTKTIPVAREPVAMDISKDGKTLIVANLVPATPSDQDYSASEVTVIDVAGKSDPVSIKMYNGAMGLRGLKVSPDGKLAAVTHMIARFHLPTTQLERGWMNTNAVSLIDVEKKTLINSLLLDDVDKGAANPWAIAWSADSETLCVSHAGTHEISVIDMPAVKAKLDKVVADKQDHEVRNDLAFLVGVRRRIPLAGKGPRSLAIVGAKAYVGEYFSDSISVVNIDPDSREAVKPIALGPKQEMTTVRKGEFFFHNAALCFQMWQSCSTCHPDARTDGLSWDLMNDGMGNPRSTKSMLLAHKTPPAMITGVRARAEVAVRSGIRFIQFAVRPEEDAKAIDEYLKSLTPTPSPFLVKGQLSEAAKRGKTLFDGKAGCSACHSGKLFTDLDKYDVGTAEAVKDGIKEFDTPSLIEVWRTGPYLWDGRAVTIGELFTAKHNAKDMHGKTTKLTEKERSDLAEYVLSL